MADPATGAEDGVPRGPVIRDRRKIDPDTGKVREAYAANAPEPAVAPPAPADGGPETGDDSAAAGRPDADPAARSAGPAGTGDGPGRSRSNGNGGNGNGGNGRAPSDLEAEAALADQLAADLAAARSAAEERLSDLQRLQAEYVNYRRRVERDRDVARDTAVAGVLEALMPVLDAVHLARQHGDLEGGPFAAIAEKLESTVARLGLVRYGDPGETFDPTVHEALMHTEAELAEGTTETTVIQVLQPGYRLGERVLRAARVAVADPQ
jgi:molecular chaperone GrpE